MLCIIFSTFLCGAVLYALNWAGALFPSNGTFDIFSYPIVQLTSTILIIFHLFVFYLVKNLTADWLSERQVCDEKLVLSGYETVMHYDPDRERKKSILFSAPFFTAAAAGMILGKTLPAVVCLGLAVFLLFQHRIGYKLAKDTVRRELYVRFPQWLMDLALLMQSNNVYVSLENLEKMPQNCLQDWMNFCAALRKNRMMWSPIPDFLENLRYRRSHPVCRCFMRSRKMEMGMWMPRWSI